MHQNDTALPIWAMELLEDQPNKQYVRIRDLPDVYFTQMKQYLPRDIRTIDGRLCITRSQFVRLIDRYNLRHRKYVMKRKAIRQTTTA